MSGGNLVYMRTLTDTPAGGVSIFCAHVTDYGRGHDVGLTTRDADLSLLPLPEIAASPVTYRASKLSGDITTTQSADISGGKGFLAPSIDGELTVVDGDGKISQDIGGGHFVPVGWSVWLAEWDETYSLAHHLVQMQVVDVTVAAGVVRFTIKSPSYIADPPLHGTQAISQFATDPIDSSNPTDPTYLASSEFSRFVGFGLGSRAVSLKASEIQPTLVVARYGQTTWRQGDIGYGTTTVANVVSLKADYIHYAGTADPFGTITDQNYLDFRCKNTGEGSRLAGELNALVAGGYHLVLSDGQWFVNVADSYLPWQLIVIPVTLETILRVYVDASASEAMLPAAAIDPTQVSLYAVPSSVAISRDQCILEGFARNKRTTSIGGQQTYDGTAQVLVPFISSASEFIGFTPVSDIGIGFSTDMPAGTGIGAIELQDGVVSLSGFSASTGDINSIIQDPSVGWNGGAIPVTITEGDAMTNMESHPLVFRIRAKPMKETYDAEFYVVDTSFEVDVVSGPSGPTSFPLFLRIDGVFGPTDDANPHGDTFDLSVTAHGQTLRASRKAPRAITRVDWKRMVQDLKSMGDNMAPKFVVAVNTGAPATGNTCVVASVTAKILETFVWAFQKFSFSDIYSTVYPFWTRGSLAALATDGAGLVVAGGTGVTTVAADGSQAWRASPLLSPNGLPPTVTRSAYGAGKFAVAGYDPNSSAPGVWTSATGEDGSWTYSALSTAPGGVAGRIRFAGTHFVALISSGSIQTSLDGITWSAPISVASLSLNDIAFDGTNYIAFGPVGHVYKSTNLTSWADVASAGIDGIVYCAVWTGTNFVALGMNGTAYVAGTTAALAGSWAQFATGTAGIIDDAAWNGLDIVAIGQDVGILVSPDGATWTNPAPDALVTGTWVPRGAGVVWTGSAWVVGGIGQLWTYAIDKGRGAWIPWLGASPENALQNLRGRFLGGLQFDSQNGSTNIWNPLQWTGGKADATQWGVAFDPPENADSGTTASAGARKICEEWWFQAGEMPTTSLDGSSDQIEMALPEINLGNIEDVATLITVQYQPFGGEYLGKAYVQNVDVDRATAGKPDSFFFAGWDASGNTNGLAIWMACRAAYLSTGALRSVSLTYDSIHDPVTLGGLWTTVDADLGMRIDWLCERPQYLKILAYGNDSKAATAYCGARYKPNFLMLNARGMSALNATGYGVVVNVSHNFTTGEHALELAFPPA